MTADTIVRSSLSLSGATRLLEAAMAEAQVIGVPMVIAITDDAGVLKAFARMDGAPQLSIELAKDKAYTAVAFGIPTHEWYEFIKDDPPLLNGIVKTPRLVVFGGGYPITMEGGVVGGIGVSGGHYGQDMAVAEAALAAWQR